MASAISAPSPLESSSSSSESDGGGGGGFRTRRNESNASFKSTSSADSGESLPFANDNAGTIKPRGAARPHPPFSLMEARSSPRSSPLSSPALRRKEGVVLPSLRHPPPPSQQQQQPSTNNFSNVPNGCSSAGPGGISSPDGTSDVLSDIGNMLANLTDELDAMLEQDLVAKTKLG